MPIGSVCVVCDPQFIIGELSGAVNNFRRWAFVAVQRASAYPTRRAVRIDCGINPGMNALLALQVLHEARSAVAVSDLLRNPSLVARKCVSLLRIHCWRSMLPSYKATTGESGFRSPI
ncbi:MAG: hypothetical protein BWY63_01431 [Chloroflexi bacterium ADurb.Bin360]|nr:MAG: hypothetical protein BWY63_01431 [Chloroflexi bacterium ADurb.Bin360]